MAGPEVSVVASAHRSASQTSKDLANWNPVRGSADADLLSELGTLVGRSRDLVRNNGVATGGIQTLADNIVGVGLRLSSMPDYRALGRDAEWSEEWSTQVEALWRGYAETTECDAAGELNFHGLTSLAFRAGMMNGEGLALPLWLPDPRSRWATRLQLVESDRLSNPNQRFDSATLRGGIEVNEYGRPLAYHIQKSHPGDWYGMLASPKGEWERIPATTEWGRRRVIHLHDKERTGQSRGKPVLSPILGDFKMLDHYRRTELQAAIVNSMIAAFVETPLDSMQISTMFGGDPSSQQFQDYLTNRRQYVAQLRGAAVIPVYPGDKIQPFTPNRPAAAFGAFCENLQREMGASVSLPYELWMKDFSKTNYSSARAALLEAWRFFRGRRQWLVNCWAAPVFELWLEETVAKGLIEAPDFYAQRAAYCKAKWIGAGKGWIDPVKEAEAAGIRMSLNISTLEDECGEQGLDWEEQLEQIAREQKRKKELGIVDVVRTVSAAARQDPNQPDQSNQP